MKKNIVYAFIDAQNLNLGVSKDIYKNINGSRIKIYNGWKLDYKRFRYYLEKKFYVEKAFIFIGFINANKAIYNYLKNCGYILIFKPTVRKRYGDVKGNIDADLVLFVMENLSLFDKAVVISGDGDFYCLYKTLKERNKLGNIIIPNSKSESSLLKEFKNEKVYLEFEKDKLEL